MIQKTKKLATILIGAALLGQVAGATEFVIFLHESSKDVALRTDSGPAGKAYWEEYTQYAGKLAQAGAMRDGAALKPLQPLSGKGKGGGLVLGGYFKIEAADLAAAQAWAQQAPAVRRGGSVEVVAAVLNPAMSNVKPRAK